MIEKLHVRLTSPSPKQALAYDTGYVKGKAPERGIQVKGKRKEKKRNEETKTPKLDKEKRTIRTIKEDKSYSTVRMIVTIFSPTLPPSNCCYYSYSSLQHDHNNKKKVIKVINTQA